MRREEEGEEGGGGVGEREGGGITSLYSFFSIQMANQRLLKSSGKFIFSPSL